MEFQKSILVIDDDDGVCDFLTAALETDHLVKAATSATAALDLVEHSRFDLVLCDAVMPGIDGFEFTRTLKRDVAKRKIPVVIMSGLRDGFNEIRAREAGAAGFLPKPFLISELLDWITAATHSAARG